MLMHCMHVILSRTALNISSVSINPFKPFDQQWYQIFLAHFPQLPLLFLPSSLLPVFLEPSPTSSEAEICSILISQSSSYSSGSCCGGVGFGGVGFGGVGLGGMGFGGVLGDLLLWDEGHYSPLVSGYNISDVVN